MKLLSGKRIAITRNLFEATFLNSDGETKRAFAYGRDEAEFRARLDKSAKRSGATVQSVEDLGTCHITFDADDARRNVRARLTEKGLVSA